MKCPNCGLFNPDSAQRCDCGYDFASGSMQRSHATDQQPQRSIPHGPAVTRSYRIVSFAAGAIVATLMARGAASSSSGDHSGVAGMGAVAAIYFMFGLAITVALGGRILTSSPRNAETGRVMVWM